MSESWSEHMHSDYVLDPPAILPRGEVWLFVYKICLSITLEKAFSLEIKTMFKKTKYEYSKHINYSVIHEGRKSSIIQKMNVFYSAFPSKFDLMITLFLYPSECQQFIVEPSWVPSSLQFFAEEKL